MSLLYTFVLAVSHWLFVLENITDVNTIFDRRDVVNGCSPFVLQFFLEG